MHSHRCTHPCSHTPPHTAFMHIVHSRSCLHVHRLILTHVHVLSGSWLQFWRFKPPRLHLSVEHFSRSPHTLPEPEAVCPMTSSWSPTTTQELGAAWQCQGGLGLWVEGREATGLRVQEGTEQLAFHHSTQSDHSHLPRPQIRWRQARGQAGALRWHQEAQTPGASRGEQGP